jgi:spermidine synthase
MVKLKTLNRTGLTAAAAGFASMAAQFLLARELMIVALGEELNVGFVFFAWLLWAGIGSAAGGAAVRRWKPGRDAVGLLMVALGALVPLSVVWSRVQGRLFGFVHGEMIPPEYVLLMCLAALAPVCFATGFLFPVLCRFEESESGRRCPSGRIYAWDTAGAACGGIIASLVLITAAGSLGTAAAAATLAGFTGAAWMSRPFRYWMWFALIAAAASSPVWLGAAGVASRTVAWGRPVRESVESGYGNITVLRDREQYSFFANGRLAGEAPDAVFGEYMAHTPLLAHPGPKRVFFIGAGPVAASEALKHKPALLVWAELDGRLLELKRKYTPENLKWVYTDPRVKIVSGDPRRYLSRNSEKYDVIVIDAGAPETVALNRYFTVEFFRLALERLTPDGVAAVTVPFTENYMGGAEKALFAGIFRSASAAMRGGIFPRLIPGPKALLLFGNGADWASAGGAAAAGRFRGRGIRSAHYSETLASYYFDPARLDSALSEFARDPAAYFADPDRQKHALIRLLRETRAPLNSDFRPAAVLNHIQYSASYSRSSAIAHFIAAHFKTAGDANKPLIDWFPLFSSNRKILYKQLAALLAVLAVCFAVRISGRKTGAAVCAVAVVGAAGMAAEIVLIFSFQVMYGVVYQYLGAINAAFLGGAAAGAAFAARKLGAGDPDPGVKIRRTALFMAFIFLMMILFVHGVGEVPASWAPWLIAAFAVAVGWSVGAVFPYTVRYRGPSGDAGVSACAGAGEASLSGGLYFADMAGAGAGALLTSSILIPVYGVAVTLCCLTILVLSAALLVGKTREKT